MQRGLPWLKGHGRLTEKRSKVVASILVHDGNFSISDGKKVNKVSPSQGNINLQ